MGVGGGCEPACLFLKAVVTAPCDAHAYVCAQCMGARRAFRDLRDSANNCTRFWTSWGRQAKLGNDFAKLSSRAESSSREVSICAASPPESAEKLRAHSRCKAKQARRMHAPCIMTRRLPPLIAKTCGLENEKYYLRLRGSSVPMSQGCVPQPSPRNKALHESRRKVGRLDRGGECVLFYGARPAPACTACMHGPAHACAMHGEGNVMAVPAAFDIAVRTAYTPLACMHSHISTDCCYVLSTGSEVRGAKPFGTSCAHKVALKTLEIAIST